MTTLIVSKSGWEDFKSKAFRTGLIPEPFSAEHDTEAGTVTVFWEPDISPAELATAEAIISAQNAGMNSVLYASIKGEIPLLKTYLSIQNPTGAQTAAATKAIIKVLRAVIKD